VEKRLKLEGSRLGVDFILRRQNKPYMSPHLFAEYISKVILPYLDELRSNEEFADKEAVLLMDDCSIHVQQETLQMIADYQVKVITFPPHTTQIFQSLDLSLIGNFKKKNNCTLPLESDETTAGFIMCIFHMMKQTLVEDNVQHAFVQLGLRYNIDTSPYTLLFDERVLRESPKFTSLWQRDYPLEKLSQGRRNVIFGWANKAMRPEWNR
jgi:hypothetical protein